MWYRNQYFIGTAAMMALSIIVAMQHVSQALGQDVERPLKVGPAPDTRTQGDYEKRLLAAAQESYEESLEEFKAEKITDPDAVYRWSLRWMKAEQAAGEDPIAAAKAHLRRMEQELAHILDQMLRAKKATEGESKHLLAYTRYYIYEAMEFVKQAERTATTDATAKPNKVASASHDAAIEVAEEYLTAVLQGNTEMAARLAAPGSLAASKRLMENFRGLASAKSLRIRGVQVSERETTVLIDEVQLAGRAKEQFTIALQRKDGRWLVTNFAAHKIAAPQNGTALGPLAQPASGKTATRVPNVADPFGVPLDTGPKETKVIVLKHAKANDLATTIADLMTTSGLVDFAMSVDARTNRVIVRGSADRVAEIVALIEQLDVPGPAQTTNGNRTVEPGPTTDPPRGNYGGAR